MVKRKLNGTVDESSVDHENRKSNVIVHINLWKIWRLALIEPDLTTGRQAGRQAVVQMKFGLGFKF